MPTRRRLDLTEQARRAGRVPESVFRLAGGNPLLVTELLKADGPAVPREGRCVRGGRRPVALWQVRARR